MVHHHWTRTMSQLHERNLILVRTKLIQSTSLQHLHAITLRPCSLIASMKAVEWTSGWVSLPHRLLPSFSYGKLNLVIILQNPLASTNFIWNVSRLVHLTQEYHNPRSCCMPLDLASCKSINMMLLSEENELGVDRAQVKPITKESSLAQKR